MQVKKYLEHNALVRYDVTYEDVVLSGQSPTVNKLKHPEAFKPNPVFPGCFSPLHDGTWSPSQIGEDHSCVIFDICVRIMGNDVRLSKGFLWLSVCEDCKISVLTCLDQPFYRGI